MKLYDIPQEIEKFEDRLINGGGELTPELEAEWANFVAQGKDKLEAAGFVINSIEGDIEKCQAEMKRLKARADAGTRNVDRLKGLTLYALKSFGGKVKTALITLWVGRTGCTTRVETKSGTDLVELMQHHPAFVRVKYEPNIEAIKIAYLPIWEQFQQEREAELLKAGENLAPQEHGEIVAKQEKRWHELLEEAGLPDCFSIIANPPTEYLRIK